MWEAIIELSNNKPTIVLFFFTLGLIGFLSYSLVKNKDFRQSVFSVFTTKKQKEKQKKVNLLESELFSKDDFFKCKINNIQFKNEHVKTDLFQIILKEKTKISIELTKEFIENQINKRDNFAKLFFAISVSVEKIIETYEASIFDKMQLYFVGKGYNISDAKKITTELYGLLYSAFKQNHNEILEIMIKILERFIEGDIYEIEDKQAFYINIIDFLLSNAILDCKETFSKLNGAVGKILDKYEK